MSLDPGSIKYKISLGIKIIKLVDNRIISSNKFYLKDQNILIIIKNPFRSALVHNLEEDYEIQQI